VTAPPKENPVDAVVVVPNEGTAAFDPKGKPDVHIKQ
jgi:hypothetical protein